MLNPAKDVRSPGVERVEMGTINVSYISESEPSSSGDSRRSSHDGIQEKPEMKMKRVVSKRKQATQNGNGTSNGKAVGHVKIQIDAPPPKGDLSTSDQPDDLRPAPRPSHRRRRRRSSRKVSVKKTDVAQREKWDNQLEFLLSCISMSVGLGNIWRFPFTAYENGGGAFLIPYFIVLVLFGRPLYFLEMCLGQFSSFGPVKMWEVVPLFRGIGYASMIAVFCTGSFYCSIMAVTVYYFIASFADVLPWSKDSCNHEATRRTNTCDISGRVNTSFAERYYFTTVFPQYDTIDNGIGTPHTNLLLCLLGSWIAIFICIVKGIKSAGKASYFTALFPYVVLVVLLVRGLTLPGAFVGIRYFIQPQWEKILQPKVWFAAVSQCFFSLNIGMGTIIFLSSHNNFRHNVFRDAVVISITDTLTSCLAGCTIFALLGYLADSLGVSVDSVTVGGPGLAFIAFPEALTQMNWFPQPFAMLFFLMMFTLGLGSALALSGQLITIIRDQVPTAKSWIVGLLVCIAGFTSGLVFITPGGQFILTLVNHHGADYVIYITATLEIVAIAWFYGVNNFIADIEFMLNRKTTVYWKICWAFVMPVGLCALLAYFYWTYEGLTHEGAGFPKIANVCAWLLTGLTLSAVPICAIHAVWKSEGNTLVGKLKASITPEPSWGPKNVSERDAWRKMKASREEKLAASKSKQSQSAPQENGNGSLPSCNVSIIPASPALDIT